MVTTTLKVLALTLTIAACSAETQIDALREKSAELGSQDSAAWFLRRDAARDCLHQARPTIDAEAHARALEACLALVERTRQ